MKLLALLLGMLVLAPLLEQFFHLLVLEDIFLTAVFAYAAYSISRNKLLLAAAISLALPAIALTWLRPFVKAQWFSILAGLCDVAFIATITIAILVYIFRQEDVSADACFYEIQMLIEKLSICAVALKTGDFFRSPSRERAESTS